MNNQTNNQKLHNQVLEFIHLLQGNIIDNDYNNSSQPVIIKIFMNGNCYQLYKILKFVFPEAEPYSIDKICGHIVTKIGDCFYDIKGQYFGYTRKLTNDDIKICEQFGYSDELGDCIPVQNGKRVLTN